MTSAWEVESPGQGQNSHNILQEPCENSWKRLCPGHRVTDEASSMPSREELGSTPSWSWTCRPRPSGPLVAALPTLLLNSPNPLPSEPPMGGLHPVTPSLTGSSEELALSQSKEASPLVTLHPGKLVGGSSLAPGYSLWAGGAAA